jgi:ribonuclease-3
MEACRTCVLSWYQSRWAEVKVGEKDSKTTLQEYVQAKHLPLPIYEVCGLTGSAHMPQFTVQCSVEGYAPTVQTASSRRIAEQQAALSLLQQLQKHEGK